MSNLISNIAKQYPRLIADGERKRASTWAVVLNNTEVSGTKLADHPKGKKIADLVCAELGYEGYSNTVTRVTGSLDDF